jgi:polyhydroxyalkanoate synthase subunit PhaE
MTKATGGVDAISDAIAQWSENWRKVADFSVDVGDAWSKSILPFMLTRAAEKRAGFGDELGDAIEKLAQGPRLADVWDIDRKLMSAFVAWSRMRQKLVAYSAVASKPWMRAFERYYETSSGRESKQEAKGWRNNFAAWSSLANEELIHNQRSEEYLAAQRELLQAGIEFRKSQTELSETVSALFALPTQRDIDEITRQLTELRREVRALARELSHGSAAAHEPTASAPVGERGDE